MKTKAIVREEVWEKMMKEKVARFPFPIKGRIPNFKGAEKATAHLIQHDLYKQAKVIKVNPDSPQLPLRAQILKDNKILLVPTPRLKAGFIQVKPEWVPSGEEKKAASLKHILSYGKEIPLHEIPPIDLMVMGSVAIHPDGRRLGKGEGFADREYGILKELGNKDIPVVTTINSKQLVSDDIPHQTYDVTVDWYVTEEGLFKSTGQYLKPKGIEWDEVTEEEKHEMPVLEEVWKLLNEK
ncbi:5-formyltetrahydrofolate cyclo-ligase [Alkalihalobacterium bogoriense]|uniref:5-formyltetrahydrofolate cyclo-ligase n=1 Tax=Alkalihalobacterium bogoriense TaxID=246272 RepID=UPI00047DB2E6|nr:5-formyltetrahydrofolate cyclo-ligase [Alkalihalobacterium bogoriense]